MDDAWRPALELVLRLVGTRDLFALCRVSRWFRAFLRGRQHVWRSRLGLCDVPWATETPEPRDWKLRVRNTLRWGTFGAEDAALSILYDCEQSLCGEEPQTDTGRIRALATAAVLRSCGYSPGGRAKMAAIHCLVLPVPLRARPAIYGCASLLIEEGDEIAILTAGTLCRDVYDREPLIVEASLAAASVFCSQSLLEYMPPRFWGSAGDAGLFEGRCDAVAKKAIVASVRVIQGVNTRATEEDVRCFLSRVASIVLRSLGNDSLLSAAATFLVALLESPYHDVLLPEQKRRVQGATLGKCARLLGDSVDGLLDPLLLCKLVRVLRALGLVSRAKLDEVGDGAVVAEVVQLLERYDHALLREALDAISAGLRPHTCNRNTAGALSSEVFSTRAAVAVAGLVASGCDEVSAAAQRLTRSLLAQSNHREVLEALHRISLSGRWSPRLAAALTSVHQRYSLL
eukprot:m51a1_g4138 hypothetical protein (458) ;mRNA; r:208105-209832